MAVAVPNSSNIASITYGGRTYANTPDGQAQLRADAANNVVPSGPGGTGITNAISLLTTGKPAPTSGGGGGGGGGGGDNSAAAALDASYQKMLQALASGNAQAFEEAKREFNQNFSLAEAGVTGSYNGQPTLASTQFNAQQAEQARQFNANLANSLLNAAIQVRGPADYMQYQQLTHGGANLLSQLTSPNAVPTAQTGAPQGANIADIFRALGIGGGGTGQPSTAMGDVQSQVLQRFGLAPGQTFSPNQFNPARYDQIGPIGQALTKNIAESLGYDPTDFESRINAQRPIGTAAGLTNTTYRAPAGIF